MKKVVPFNSKSDADSSVSKTPLAVALPSGDPAPGLAPSWSDSAEQQLLLMQRIIGCTDIETLLSRFYRWASDLGLASGLSYTPAGETEVFSYGNRRHHSASYELSLDGSQLGSIALCRRDRFSENELLTIEQALGTFARCLRSAIEFTELQQLVTQDPLTGLGNRTSLHQWMERELSRTRRHNSPLALMMIDVDHFKQLNDELGHLGGDKILRAIASVFKRSTRGSDLLFRFGGDEFTIILPHTDCAGATEAAQQIRKNLAALSNEQMGLDVSFRGTRPDLSIGIACYQSGDTDVSLLQRADTHLYHAKAQGRGAVCNSI
jgi:diguanylate cyclase (GGDEF)-like protein